MKKRIVDEEKEYLIIKQELISIGFGNKFNSNVIKYVDRNELIDYIKANGTNNIKCVLKNKPIEIETIVNIK